MVSFHALVMADAPAPAKEKVCYLMDRLSAETRINIYKHLFGPIKHAYHEPIDTEASDSAPNRASSLPTSILVNGGIVTSGEDLEGLEAWSEALFVKYLLRCLPGCRVSDWDNVDVKTLRRVFVLASMLLSLARRRVEADEPRQVHETEEQDYQEYKTPANERQTPPGVQKHHSQEAEGGDHAGEDDNKGDAEEPTKCR